MDVHPLVNLLVPIQSTLSKQREAFEAVRRNERLAPEDVHEVAQLLDDLQRDLQGQIQRLRRR